MHSQPFQGPPPPLGRLMHMRYGSFHASQLQSVRHVREEFRAAAHISQLDADIAEAAELCLSELASNAVRHARDPRRRRSFYVECNIRGVARRFLELSVQDIDASRIPDLPDPETAAEQLFRIDEDAETGRGLLLVALRADGIGVDHGPNLNGKRMWCRFYLPSTPVPVDPRTLWAAAR